MQMTRRLGKTVPITNVSITIDVFSIYSFIDKIVFEKKQAKQNWGLDGLANKCVQYQQKRLK